MPTKGFVSKSSQGQISRKPNNTNLGADGGLTSGTGISQGVRKMAQILGYQEKKIAILTSTHGHYLINTQMQKIIRFY